ncbi:protein kinase domain-containing protein [Melissospora conviva]|uniref:serine/threonine-protein kinase n=1 Tax=Melissospora conviva TaxID=3388432 RepID=UPI003C223785
MQSEPIAGRYELVEHVKSGGMGQVWRGYDTVLDREVAVKLIRTSAVTTDEDAEELARRFQREARITASIQHHGVPQVYDAGLDAPFDRLYLVMEYVRGSSLRAFIDPDRPLPIAWAVAIAAQICTVLAHAHAMPVVHRDLKPDNILVAPDGTVKLLDFGIAAVLRSDVTRLTRSGMVLGSDHYMSPEQFQSAQVTPRTDLYALGCVLHELLTGQRLFNGDNPFDLMQEHLHKPPMPLRTGRPDVPEALDELVLRLLAKAPDQRPADAYEVYEALLPLLPPSGSMPSVEERGPEGTPDPTLLYRRPNSPPPRPVTRPAADLAGPAPAPTTDGVSAREARHAIKNAFSESGGLLDEGRFTQAGEVLRRAIETSAPVLGIDNPELLGLRARRAAVLALGGDHRRALAEFEALIAAYARTVGPGSDQVMDYLEQAAYCHAELGETTSALEQFRRVREHVSLGEGDVSERMIELRKMIGVLLMSQGETKQALAELAPLHDDLMLLFGPDDERTQEIADLLARLDPDDD